jgi:hypothetical protein
MDQLVTFKPTPGMQRCKANLHRACPPSLIPTLMPTDQSLCKYIAPTPPVQFRKWHAENGESFWEWLLTAPEHDGKGLEARDMAYAALMEILELPIRDEIGGLNIEVLKAKQKAIDTVLAKNVPLVAIQNNNSTVDGMKMPPGLQRKTAFELSEMQRKMLKHVPSDQLTIEGEIANDNEQRFAN